MNASRNKPAGFFPWLLTMLAVFVGLQGLFFLGSVAASALPKEPILQHLEESADDPLLSQVFRYDAVLFGSSVSFDNNRFIEAFARQDPFDGDAVKASILDRVVYTMPEGQDVVDYYRYWHGWQLPVFLVLLVGDAGLLSLCLGLLALGAAAFFLVELHHYAGWVPAAAFTGVAFFSTNILGNFLGDLLLALSVSAVVLCAAFALRVGRKGSASARARVLDALCLASGCLFCYLDFFTVPAFALGLAVFSSMVARGVLDRDFKTGLLLCLRFALIFGAAFVGTWMCKWLLASCYLGLAGVLAEVAGETSLWSQGESVVPPGYGWLEDHPRLYALYASFRGVMRGDMAARGASWNAAGLAAAGVVAAGFVLMLWTLIVSKARHRSVGLTGGAWSVLLPSVFVPAYIMFSYHHVLFHLNIFGYKSWAFVLASAAFFCLYVWRQGFSRRRGEGAHARESSKASPETSEGRPEAALDT